MPTVKEISEKLIKDLAISVNADDREKIGLKIDFFLSLYWESCRYILQEMSGNGF